MKHMLFIPALALMPLFSSGQLATGVSDAAVRESDGNIEVGFTVETGRFPRDLKVTFVPVVYDSYGNAHAMKPLTVTGRRKSISDRRAGLPGDGIRLNRSRYRYSASEPRREWMTRVSLAVYGFCEDCRGPYEENPLVAVHERLIHYDIEPAFSLEKIEMPAAGSAEGVESGKPFLRPVAGYSDRFEISAGSGSEDAATIYFHAGRHDIDPAYRGNANSLQILSEAIAAVRNDGSVQLRRILVSGFASPEGNAAKNGVLAGKRAEAVREYILRESGLDGEMVEAFNRGEDWDELRRMVEGSDMPERKKILYIIDLHREGDQLSKQKMRHLAGGVPYAYMVGNFFPLLRSSGHVNICLGIDTAGALSPVAAQVSSLNAAQELMMMEEWEKALAELDNAGGDPRAYNLKGVSHMMLGDYPEAEKWLRKALEAGDGYAAANLRRLETARTVADENSGQ